MSNESSKGKLQIGDEWNAIRLIALSQTNAQKAVAELVENSIDAKARNITIQRYKRQGRVALLIKDDGEGVKYEDKNPPDSLKKVPIKICDSFKRNLKEAERTAIHGQFAIGILGFWSIGKEFYLISKTKSSETHCLKMVRDERDWEVNKWHWERDQIGTDALITDLNKEVQSRLTAERLAKYLAEELRNRLRQTEVNITIHDRILHKILEVRPVEFAGEPIKEIQKIEMEEYPNIKVELYFTFPQVGATPFIAVEKDGTRVLSNISQLDEFNCPPWNTGKLEGAVDFPVLNLAPATRGGIVPDEIYYTFVKALKSLEPALIKLIQGKEEIIEERLSKQTLERLQKAFVEAFDRLPEGDYSWFEIPEEGILPGLKREREKEPKEHEEEETKPPLPTVEPGPLDHVVIVPGYSHIPFHGERRFTAKSFDSQKIPIESRIEYFWEGGSGLGTIKNQSGESIVFLAGKEEGTAYIWVKAKQGEIEKDAKAAVVIVKERPHLGFPPPEFTPQPLETWRSKWNEKRNTIEINSAHRDYIFAKESGRAAYIKYTAWLYAKELVLLNFPEFPPPEILERLVEVVTYLETNI